MLVLVGSRRGRASRFERARKSIIRSVFSNFVRALLVHVQYAYKGIRRIRTRNHGYTGKLEIGRESIPVMLQ